MQPRKTYHTATSVFGAESSAKLEGREGVSKWLQRPVEAETVGLGDGEEKERCDIDGWIVYLESES